MIFYWAKHEGGLENECRLSDSIKGVAKNSYEENS